jgi:hypothetical protein
MRFFTFKLKSRRVALRVPKATAEIPLVSVKAKALLNYNTMHKDALDRECRSINMR